ncbi:hypothetical protein F1H49_20205 [Salmonella enterica]|nr:hypothetical protein [Salmonella enterica]ECR4969869.1 hypothetical protein [Salmonella enterica]
MSGYFLYRAARAAVLIFQPIHLQMNQNTTTGYFLYRVAPGNSAYFLINPSSDESKYRNWLFFVPFCPGQQRLFFNQFTIRRTKTSQLVIFCTVLPRAAAPIF